MTQFKKITWGKEKETEVQFEVENTLPPTELISTCFIVPIYKGKVVMTKFSGGWGFPGGHREEGESAEESVRREATEESSVILDEVKLVGRWKAEKVKETEFNKKYPKVAYQLLYVAEVKELLEFVVGEEFFERRLVSVEEVRGLHFNYAAYGDVYDFVLERYVALNKS